MRTKVHNVVQQEGDLLNKYVWLVGGLLLLAGLSSCKDRQSASPQLAKFQIQLENIQLSISPGQIPVETLLQLQLQSKQPLKQVTAEIVGVSMYMGRIPLRFTFDDNSGLWRSDFMLGACSDPNMIWQLRIQLTDTSGKVNQLNTEFQSSWP